jgi:hypothetical protein
MMAGSRLPSTTIIKVLAAQVVVALLGGPAA